MTNYTDEILSHYGIKKTAQSSLSMEHAIDSYLHTVIYRGLIASKAVEAHWSARISKVKHGHYVGTGKATVKAVEQGAGTELEYKVQAKHDGKKVVVEIMVSNGRHKETQKSSFMNSEKIEKIVVEVGRMLDTLGGF